jgi:arylsulfatase A-like enzyme
VVLWGDHGWHLGEKEHWGKWTGWERATRVPLLMVPPRAAAAEYRTGTNTNSPVSLVDLFPTLIDLCGLPAKDDLDGQSFKPVLKDPAAATRPVVTTFDHQNYSVRTQRWRLIRYADGSEELYDHEADPNEWHNLAGEPQSAEVLGQLRAVLPSGAARPQG